MNLTDALKRFNRKERFWLIRKALGPASERLDDAFRAALGQAIRADVPADAWWAMDYHIDWLVGALAIVGMEADASDVHLVRENLDNSITGSQEDMDLVVAFGQTLVLVEAKCDTAWSNSQFESKVRRLERLQKAAAVNSVKLVFVVMSPDAPSGIDLRAVTDPASELFFDNGKLRHVPLRKDPGNFLKVTRWDPVLGKPAATDGHWRIVSAGGESAALV